MAKKRTKIIVEEDVLKVISVSALKTYLYLNVYAEKREEQRLFDKATVVRCTTTYKKIEKVTGVKTAKNMYKYVSQLMELGLVKQHETWQTSSGTHMHTFELQPNFFTNYDL